MPLQTFANFEYEKRIKKARKIAGILGSKAMLKGTRVLDIGTGSGVCADFFANHVVGHEGFVAAVDRSDQRLLKNNYQFELVEGACLPFESNSFDIVISNHVIEHVWPASEQLTHLKEISRVLKNTGTLYLVFPNKYAVIEPHYKLPFLSWLPQYFADKYVRILGGRIFDCHTPSQRRLAGMLRETDLREEEVTEKVLAYVVKNELEGCKRAFVKLIFPLITVFFMSVIPTRVYLLRKKD